MQELRRRRYIPQLRVVSLRAHPGSLVITVRYTEGVTQIGGLNLATTSGVCCGLRYR